MIRRIKPEHQSPVESFRWITRACCTACFPNIWDRSNDAIVNMSWSWSSIARPAQCGNLLTRHYKLKRIHFNLTNPKEKSANWTNLRTEPVWHKFAILWHTGSQISSKLPPNKTGATRICIFLSHRSFIRFPDLVGLWDYHSTAFNELIISYNL